MRSVNLLPATALIVSIIAIGFGTYNLGRSTERLAQIKLQYVSDVCAFFNKVRSEQGNEFAISLLKKANERNNENIACPL